MRRKYFWKFGNCMRSNILKRRWKIQKEENILKRGRNIQKTENILKRERKIQKAENILKHKRKIQKAEENMKPTIEITSQSKKDIIDRHTYLDEQSCKEKKNLYVVQSEAQSEEDSCDDKFCTAARTLSYDFHRKIISSSNNAANVETSSDSSFSFSLNNRREQDDDKTSMSKYDLYQNKTKTLILKQLMQEKLKYISKATSIQQKLNKLKRKKNRIMSSDEESYEPVSKKKYRRIITLNTSDNEGTSTSTNNTTVLYDKKASRKLYLSHERMDQEESQTSIQIIQEARIILTRLEELDDVDAVKWRKKKMNASRMAISPTLVKEQVESKVIIDHDGKASECNKKSLDIKEQVKNSITLKQIHQNNRLISSENAFLTEKKDKAPPQLLDNNSNSSNIKELKEKYKLFKKPKVLMIRLENLKNSSKNNRYSAEEIDRLTIKCYNSVIHSSSLCKSDKPLYRYMHRKKYMTSIAHAEEDASSSMCAQRIDDSFKQSVEKDSTKDTQVTNNSNTNNPLKIRINCRSLSIIPSQNNFSSLNTSKKKSDSPQKKSDSSQKKSDSLQKKSDSPQKKSDLLQKKSDSSQKKSDSSQKKSDSSQKKSDSSQKTLQEIWQNAFIKKPAEKLQAQQSTSSHSTVEATSVTRNSPKKLTDAERQSVSSVLASTSSTSSKRNNTSIASPKKCASPKKQETTAKSTKEPSKSELSVADTNSSHTANVEEAVRKILLEYKLAVDSTVKNPQKVTAAKKVFRCNVCDNLFENSRQLQIHKTNSGCKRSTMKSPSISNVLGLATDKVNKHKLKKSIRFSSIKNKKVSLLSNKTDQSLGCSEQIVSSSSSKTSEISNNNLPTKAKVNKCLESKLDLDSQSKEKLRNITVESGVQLTCNVCSKVFDNYIQLYTHIQKHSDFKLRNAYKMGNKALIKPIDKPVKNTENSKVAEVGSEKSSEEVIIEQENVNKLHAVPRVHEVSQYNLSNKKNKTSPEVKNLTLRDLEEQLSVTSGAETEKKNYSICECHKATNNLYNDIPIEIAIFCDICMTVFRRFDCFETHCQRSKKCIKNRRFGRKPMLLCGNCLETFDSMQTMWHHLKIYFSSNSEFTATFYCNICKVLFYGIGSYFYNHFRSHLSNPHYLTSRLSFPKYSFIGMKLVQLPTADGRIIWESYTEIADSLVCKKCKIPFAIRHDLTLHEKVCQSKKVRILLICGFCNKTFYNRAQFEKHSLEHKMKRNFHSHYIRVAVTALTNVFICKVCMAMWKSQEMFEEHWLTHGTLQEDYVCSLCEKHFDTIDLFQEHAIVHVNNNKQQPISCKVIYRDIDNQNLPILGDEDLSRTNLDCFTRKEPVGNIANNKSCEKSSTAPASPNVLGKIIDEMTKNFTTANKSGKDIPQIAPTKKRTVNNNNKVCTEDCSNIITSKSNLENLVASEKKKQTIVVSENEESVNEIQKYIQCSDKIAQENVAKSNFAVIADEQELSNDLDLALMILETSSVANENSNSNGNDKNSRESIIQLGASTNVLKEVNKTSVGDKSIEFSTTATTATAMTTTMATTATAATAVITTTTTMTAGDNHAIKSSLGPCDQESLSRPITSDANNSNKNVKKLPENVMSVVPKSFLRVKSLAELTNTHEKRCLCHLCDLPFESTVKLKEHLLTTHRVLMNQNNQALNDMRQKPEFNPSVVSTQVQNRPFYPTMYSNVPLPNNASPSSNIPMSDYILSNSASNTSHLQLPNQKVNQIKFLANPNLYGTLTNDPTKTSSNKTPNPTEFQLFMSSINNSISATQPQQFRQSQQLQQQQQLQQTQMQAYHQNLPHCIAQPVNRTGQFFQQQQQQQRNIGTASVKPFSQTAYQAPKSQTAMYMQQQQQGQQQKQMNVNERGYLMTNMPHPLASNNMMPMNSDNVMFMPPNTMQQTSRDPRHCLPYYPNF